MRRGVVTSAIPTKGFDVGTVGSVPTPIDPSSAATIPVMSAAIAPEEYSGSSEDGTDVLVVAPDSFSSLDSFRLLVGTLSALKEAVVKTVSRGLSIPSSTTIRFSSPFTDTNAVLTYPSDSTDATLVGTSSVPLKGITGAFRLERVVARSHGPGRAGAGYRSNIDAHNLRGAPLGPFF